MTPDQRQEIFARDGYICKICGRHIYNLHPQIAHRIKQGKQTINFLKKHKNGLTDKQCISIINHELNLVTTCSLKCNDKCNIFYNPVERDDLLNKIMKELSL